MLPSLGVGHAEVFSSHSADWNKQVKGTGAVARVFDKVLKGYLVAIDHPGSIEVPQKGSLALIQRFLVLQVFIARGRGFTTEIAFVDHSNTRRRIAFTQTKEVVTHPLHVRLPSEAIQRNVWLNLCFDVVNLAQHCFPHETFKHLDQVRVSSVCRLRRIFTMKTPLVDSTGKNQRQSLYYDAVPSAYDFPRSVKVVNQVISAPVLAVFSKSQSPPKLPRLPMHKATRSQVAEAVTSRSPKKLQFDLPSSRQPDVDRFRSAAPSPRSAQGWVEESPSLLRPSPSPEQLYPGDTFEQDTDQSPIAHIDYFSESLQQAVDVRHFTPPFFNVVIDQQRSTYRYDPVSRSYAPAN